MPYVTQGTIKVSIPDGNLTIVPIENYRVKHGSQSYIVFLDLPVPPHAPLQDEQDEKVPSAAQSSGRPPALAFADFFVFQFDRSLRYFLIDCASKSVCLQITLKYTATECRVTAVRIPA